MDIDKDHIEKNGHHWWVRAENHRGLNDNIYLCVELVDFARHVSVLK